MTENESARIGEARVRRLLDEEHQVLVLAGDFGRMFAAYLDHAQRWESLPDGLSQTLMRQGLGAATLHLACRPRGEVRRLDAAHPAPPDERVSHRRLPPPHRDRPASSRRTSATPSRGGSTCRSRARDGTPLLSTVEIEGVDVLQIFETYYRQSEQRPARFYEITDEEFVMFAGLPETDPEWLQGLPRETAIGIAGDGLRLLDEQVYRFQCGCSLEKILETVRGMFAKNPEELFAGEPGVEVFCPRCARRWWVDREDFHAGG